MKVVREDPSGDVDVNVEVAAAGGAVVGVTWWPNRSLFTGFGVDTMSTGVDQPSTETAPEPAGWVDVEMF